MKNAESCVQSIWALLPSVCNYPVDTAQGFGLIAKALGDALNKEPELRGLICSSLQVFSIHLYLRLVETSQTTVHYEVSYAMYKTPVMLEHCKMRLCRKLVH
jgi:hypothetical protein